MNVPTIDPAQPGANIVTLRKAAGLIVADTQMVFGFNSPPKKMLGYNQSARFFSSRKIEISLHARM